MTFLVSAAPGLQPPYSLAKANRYSYLVLSSPVTKLRSSGPTCSPSGNAEHCSEDETKAKSNNLLQTSHEECSEFMFQHLQSPLLYFIPYWYTM